MKNFTYRLHIAKTGKQRFLSHHDLMRSMERAIRRSGIPIEYSEGFNPRPRISYHTALALGIESLDEIVDIELGVWKPPADIHKAVGDQMPQGLKVLACEPVLPKAQTGIDKVCYSIAFFPRSFVDSAKTTPYPPLIRGNEPPERLPLEIVPPKQADIDRLMACCEAFIVRVNPKGTRRLNVRPYISELRIEDSDHLLMVLNVTSEGTARPEEVLSLMGLPPLPPGIAWRITKTKTTFQSPGQPQPDRSPRRRYPPRQARF